MSHLHETGHVGTSDEVEITIGLSVADALVMDSSHDVVQTFVDLLSRP